MDDIIAIFRNHRPEILSSWIHSVLPEYPNNTGATISTLFENPLHYEVGREFNEILDYLLSDDPSFLNAPAPVAQTLIKFKALGFNTAKEGNSSTAVNYPIQLRNTLIPYFSYLQHKNIEILLSIDIKIEQLLLAAFDFYLKTREEIFTIKLKELERGVLAGQASGCPSGSAVFEDVAETKL